MTLRFIGCLFITLICGALFYVTPVHISLVLTERGFSDPAMLGLASAMDRLAGDASLVTDHDAAPVCACSPAKQ